MRFQNQHGWVGGVERGGLRNAITRGQVRRREKGMCERSRRRSWWLRALTHTWTCVCVCACVTLEWAAARVARARGESVWEQPSVAQRPD